ncbi:hypothetical protein Poli38472_012387 [Pythium oligandrum]|uniref:Uncharacterized protein n=1 Tax=Pythium oligandrum TaxID=41045 RepID=A0A8K1CRC7_PYTOL|nr:hypothetical protein Poli38472_012387 [Pythium oligandrum]|eukprot:TMW67271.1 hypothetical protein Poli38472_012387 [Pythium oligandrum]
MVTTTTTVYWPQRRLQRVFKATGTANKEALYLLGFSVTERTFCVVDITEKRPERQFGAECIGRCHVNVSASVGASNELVVVYEERANWTPDEMDAHIRVMCTGGNAHCNVVLYDPELCQHGSLRRGLDSVDETSTTFRPLQQLCDYFDRTSTTKRSASSTLASAGEAVGYYSILLPFDVARALANAFDATLSVQIPQWSPLAAGANLKDYSQFLAVLIRQGSNIANLPRSFRYVYRSKKANQSNAAAPSYIGLWDTIVSLALDAIAGYFFSTLIFTYLSTQISTFVHPSMIYSSLREYIVWLMDAPAGFKLNLPLATIMGNGILLCLDLWEFLLESVLSHSLLETVMSTTWTSVVLKLLWTHMGLSLQLSLLSDVLGLVTWNSYWVYLYFTKLNAVQFALLGSLWKLFLGKKNNVLRKRVDSSEYDVNQLLIGTLMFTILSFLAATNSVFFVFFGLVRLGVWSMRTLLWLPIVLLRVLPFASVLYRVTHPRHYTGSIRLEAIPNQEATKSMSVSSIAPSKRRARDEADRQELRQFLSQLSTDARAERCAYFRVVTRPTGLGQVFSRLKEYQSEIGKRYNGKAVSQSCFFGARIAPVPLAVLFGDTLQSSEGGSTSHSPDTKSKTE